MILTIIGIIVGIATGANTLMEFGERIHSYHRALKERRNRLLGSSYLHSKHGLTKAEPPSERGRYTPNSYRAYMWLLPAKDYGVDMVAHDPPQKGPYLKKISFSPA